MDTSFKNINTQVNGKIDSTIYQNDLNDCALIASIFSMAQTTKGAKNLENSININNSNGEKSYDVTFKGLDETYNVTQEEIENAQNDPERQYATGDSDMTLIELAFEKCLNESNNETLDSFYVNPDDKLTGISLDLINYLFAGETGKTLCEDKTGSKSAMTINLKFQGSILNNEDLFLKDTQGNDIKLNKNTEYTINSINKDGTIDIQKQGEDSSETEKYTISKDELYNSNYLNYKSFDDTVKLMANQALENFENDKENTAVVFENGDTKQYTEVKNSNGDNAYLVGSHAYSVIDVNDDTVTLVNPWNTAEEIEVNRQELLNLDDYTVYQSNV